MLESGYFGPEDFAQKISTENVQVPAFVNEDDGVLTIKVPLSSEYSNETIEQTNKFAQILAEALALFAQKQHDYGRGNIAKFGEFGVLVRASDKLERLANLQGKEAKNESVEDTWKDIGNYGFIGLMAHRGEW